MQGERVHSQQPRLGGNASWLCRDEFDRDRMLDMEARVRPVRQCALTILAIALVCASPWLGWWPALFLIPAAVFFAAADKIMPRVAKPELLMFGAWVASGLVIGGAVALSGGPDQPTLSWLAIPVITLSSRFPMRGVVVGVAINSLILLAVAFGVNAHRVIDDPVYVIAPLALLMCVAVLSTPLMRSDIQHRSDAVIDQLTGMLNRKALSTRVVELAQQSQLTGESVGIIIGDLDHFKQINDTRGHSVGDVVLKDVAYQLRKQLRAFDLAYRLGGEEFLILLPGSDLAGSAELAERLRLGIAENSVIADVGVTMSFGVGASGRGEPFVYADVFTEADEALYRAKRNGRDQVGVPSSPRGAPVPAFA
jgi:diguanylate cyclase (GGDEF)-like protein